MKKLQRNLKDLNEPSRSQYGCKNLAGAEKENAVTNKVFGLVKYIYSLSSSSNIIA